MKSVLAALVFASVATAAIAQNFSADELSRRNIERRGVEAMIWGMPAVNTDLMLQEMLSKTSARVNEIVYWSRPVNWKNQTLTPNPDSIYFMSFWNTKNGPVVIDVPPAQGGSIAGTSWISGRCRWKMPVRKEPTRATVVSI